MISKVLKINNLNNLPECEICGAKNYVINSDSLIVCRNCGFVLDKTMVQLTPYKESKRVENQWEVNQFPSTKQTLKGTTFSYLSLNPKWKRLFLYNKSINSEIHNIDYRNLNAIREIRKITTFFSLPNLIYKTAVKLLPLLNKAIFEQTNKRPISFSIAISCILISAKKYNFPLNFEDIIKMSIPNDVIPLSQYSSLLKNEFISVDNIEESVSQIQKNLQYLKKNNMRITKKRLLKNVKCKLPISIYNAKNTLRRSKLIISSKKEFINFLPNIESEIKYLLQNYVTVEGNKIPLNEYYDIISKTKSCRKIFGYSIKTSLYIVICMKYPTLIIKFKNRNFQSPRLNMPFIKLTKKFKTNNREILNQFQNNIYGKYFIVKNNKLKEIGFNINVEYDFIPLSKIKL